MGTNSFKISKRVCRPLLPAFFALLAAVVIHSMLISAATPRTTVTPMSGAGNYEVVYTIQNDWGSGATVNVTITNNTTAAVNGWILAWTFPGNQTITNLWNGTFTQSGASVTVKNASYNTTIPANGGSLNFGFNLNYSGANAKPASFTLNGIACYGGDVTPMPTPSLTPTPTHGNKSHCFLLLGQSNMAGYALAQAADKVEDSRVLVLGYDNNPAFGRVTDRWDVACPPPIDDTGY